MLDRDSRIGTCEGIAQRWNGRLATSGIGAFLTRVRKRYVDTRGCWYTAPDGVLVGIDREWWNVSKK